MLTNDVLISIAGLQYEMDQEATLEVIVPGKYYFRNEKIYLKYEELSEEGDSTDNLIKIDPMLVVVSKKGTIESQMIFEMGKQTSNFYHTPFGELMIGIDTTRITIQEANDTLQVKIDYSLSVNYAFIADCVIEIKVEQID